MDVNIKLNKYMRNFILGCCLVIAGQAAKAQLVLPKSKQTTIINPVNLSYRFALDGTSRREAADPAMINFRGEYYLFASKSGGYFHSTDLVNWNLIKTNDLPLEDYAPTAMVYRGEVYFMASGNNPLKIYKTADPKSGKWTVVTDKFPITMIDPFLFADDDDRVYFYYGCSNVNPLYAVELDPKTMLPLGQPTVFFNSDKESHGWERRGDYQTVDGRPWIEGSWVTKHNGKYYWQYSAPGTEFKSYNDGVYVSDKPMGPFTLMPNNPGSMRPEGFIAGAGHSGTFKDNYGNYWRISTDVISVKHMFERRLSLFPLFFDKDGIFHTYTDFGDFPLVLPKKQLSSPAELKPKWMLLSYKKPVEVSSAQEKYPKENASDEEVRTYWSAATGDKGEWLTMDLKKVSTVNAVQINYAENEATSFGRSDNDYYQYLLQYSTDKKTWKTLADKRTNKIDAPHDYLELSAPVKARYIRLTNYKVPSGKFAIADLRVFGKGTDGLMTQKNDIFVSRSKTDPCVADISWIKTPNAVGYNVRYGTAPDKLYHTYQVMGAEKVTIRSLNKSESYYFTVDAFNENGIKTGNPVIKVD